MGRVILVARYFLNLAIYSILLEGERADGYVRYSRKIVLKKRKITLQGFHLSIHPDRKLPIHFSKNHPPLEIPRKISNV